MKTQFAQVWQLKLTRESWLISLSTREALFFHGFNIKWQGENRLHSFIKGQDSVFGLTLKFSQPGNLDTVSLHPEW